MQTDLAGYANVLVKRYLLKDFFPDSERLPAKSEDATQTSNILA
jgi:hypothetical protein